MPLSAGKVAFKNTMKAYLDSVAANTDEDKDNTIEEYLDALADAVEAYVQTAGVSVPGTGLVAPNGPVTGLSTTGQLL